MNFRFVGNLVSLFIVSGSFRVIKLSASESDILYRARVGFIGPVKLLKGIQDLKGVKLFLVKLLFFKEVSIVFHQTTRQVKYLYNDREKYPTKQKN